MDKEHLEVAFLDKLRKSVFAVARVENCSSEDCLQTSVERDPMKELVTLSIQGRAKGVEENVAELIKRVTGKEIARARGSPHLLREGVQVRDS
jgi:hypothetical protein